MSGLRVVDAEDGVGGRADWVCDCPRDGYGRLGRRPSSMRGTRASMASVERERRGKGEKRSGWVSVCRVRV